jgi:integrase
MAKQGRYLFKREGFWYFARRVPLKFRVYDPRGAVQATLGIRIADDPKGIQAALAAAQMNADLEGYWRGLVDGNAQDQQKRFEAARLRARQLGFNYVGAHDLARDASLPEILKRISVLESREGRPDHVTSFTALMGMAPQPQVLLSTLFETYERSVATAHMRKSPDQLRKWRTARTRAIKSLVSFIGDKPVDEVTRDDALDYRAMWQARVESGTHDADTANKQFTQLRVMFKTVDRLLRLNLKDVFGDLVLSGGAKNKRPAFSTVYIETAILGSGALDRLNAEARDLTYILIETGLRLSEACNLTSKTIVLNVDVPYVSVRPEGRETKTKTAIRDIPLVGYALDAAVRNPEGFSRYREKASHFSATVNKFLKENGLDEGGGKTIYSFRHSFKDRLRNAKTDSDMMNALMGHASETPLYGDGASLEVKREALLKIAFARPRGA